MVREDRYDVVVIGAGSAGFTAASVARERGKRVCLIEAEKLGGECPNWACVPTKAMLRSAKAYYEMKHGVRNFGVHAQGVTFNFRHIMRWRETVVSTITGSGKRMRRLAKDEEIDVVMGVARFVNAHTISVGKRKIQGKSIVVAGGMRNFVPPIDGIEDIDYLTFREVVQLKSQPRRVLIVGAGPVGCEFATFFGMLGSKTVLVQLGAHVLQREDEEISIIAERRLADVGVKVLLETKTLSVEQAQKAVKVVVQTKDGARRSVEVDALILATGRRADWDSLRIAKAGLKPNDRGRILVNDRMQTAKEHIYLAGDVAGGYAFTHTAHHQGMVAGMNAAGGEAVVDLRVVPRVTFVYPEVASVGLTAVQAAGMEKDFVVKRFPIGALGRAVSDGAREGVLKLVVDRKTGEIYGGHMIGERAGEVIHEVALAMHVEASFEKVVSMIHAFPTYSEAIAALG